MSETVEVSKKAIARELLERGKKSGVLTFKEIMDAFEAVDIAAEQIDKVYETLEKAGIEIVADMDKELESYILNYKINLFDYHDYKDFSMFKTENRELFEVLSCAKDKAAMDVLIHENAKRYGKLSYDSAQLICDIAGIEIELVKEVEQDGREVADMCKAWDDHKRDGIEEGIKEGIKIFVEDKIEDGIPEETIIDRLVRRFNLNEKKAKQYYRMYS